MSLETKLSVTAIVTDEVTAVEVAGVDINGWYCPDMKGTGWSKKHPKDQPNEEIAFHLAMARALQELSNSYAKTAANLAGFPIEVDLGGTVDPDGEPAAVVYFPLDSAPTLDDLKKVTF